MRVVLIDDHELVRDSLRRLLSDTFLVSEVVEAEDLDAGLQLLSEGDTPDLIIADLNMPGSSGPESMGALAEAFPDSRVVVVSGSEQQEDVIACLTAGVSGYIPKSLPVSELVEALRQVLSGGVYLPRALRRRRGQGEPRPRRNLAGFGALTPRQRDVLDELLLGKSSKEIARALDLADGTVKIHLAAIYRALGVKTRAEAIAKVMAG